MSTTGQNIIDAIISGKLLHATCAQESAHNCIVVWSSGAAEQVDAVVEAALAEAKAEVARLNKPWTVSIVAPTNDDPFNRLDCTVIDIGHSDRRLVVECSELTAIRAEVAELREDKARLETHPRIASLVSSPTAGHYTVMQRGTSIVLQDFLKSPDKAEAWCTANGWTLFPSPAIKQLVDACRAALDETANYSGLSDDSEPVLSFETRKILYAALKAAKAAKLFP